MHDHTHELTLGLAFGLGALHALEPGHGKTAMLVYLAGERRSLLHPIVMGLSSALAHSVSLIAIAAVVHLTHHLVTGDHHHEDDAVVAGMRWASAFLVIGVGVWMTIAAFRKRRATACACCGNQRHGHDGDQHESHAKGLATSYSMSALLGVAFGLLPCPSAMAAYFTSISMGSPVAAYGAIALFAAGIACSITTVGLAVQAFGGQISAVGSRFPNLPWPFLRAAFILAIGIAYLTPLLL